MSPRPDHEGQHPQNERVAIPLAPEEALRALLQVKPDEPAESRKPKTAAKNAPRSEKRR